MRYPLRRKARLIWIFLGALLSVLAFAGSAQAALNLVSPQNQSPVPGPYQHWISTSLVPTPNIDLAFKLATCPTEGFEDAWGCTIVSSYADPLLYLSPYIGDHNQTIDTLRHEVAHVFDELYLTEIDRARFSSLIGSSRHWEQGEASPSERFAVAYALVARYSSVQYRALFPRASGKAGSRYHARSLRRTRAKKQRGIYWESGYRATSRRHEQVRRFIEHVALKNHLG